MNICILSTCGVSPINSGIAERIFQTANILGRTHDIDLYHFEVNRENKGRTPDSCNFKEQRVRSSAPKQQSALRPVSILHLASLLKTFVARKNVGVIQCEVPVNFLHAYKYKLKYGAPVVLTAHDIVFMQNKRSRNPLWPVIKLVEIACFKLADHIVTVSEFDRDIVTKYVPEEKVTVIPNGVDLELYRPGRPKMDLHKMYGVKGPVLGFHGLLSYQPNREAAGIILDNLVPRLDRMFESYKVLLMGPNPPEINHPRVVCTGVVDDLPGYLRSLDAAIVPLASGSGTRLKILEYLASGTPVVASRIAAEGIFARNYEHLVFADDFTDDFVNKIAEVMANERLRREITANGRKLVETHYAWEQVIPGYNRVYEKLIAQTSADIGFAPRAVEVTDV